MIETLRLRLFLTGEAMRARRLGTAGLLGLGENVIAAATVAARG